MPFAADSSTCYWANVTRACMDPDLKSLLRVLAR